MTQEKPKPPVIDSHSLMWFLFLFTVYYIVLSFDQPQSQLISYSVFKEAVQSQQVSDITIRGDVIKGHYKQSQHSNSKQRYDFKTILPSINDNQLIAILEENEVAISSESKEQPLWLNMLIGVLPWLLIFAFFIYSSRMLQQRMGGTDKGIFGFSKSKARLYQPQDNDLSFDDVAGVENAKQELQEVIQFLKTPEQFYKLGARMPRGILLMGPPGTGKTLLAKATAAEAGVPFFSISGSEFIEMFVGVGASRVRDMFQQARQKAPSLIFVDEIDSVGRVRGAGLGGGNDEREQTLNQILAEMDGFSKEEAIIVLAATNRPDVLDPALLRPGRFDRKVVLELPQREAREKILHVHCRGVPLAKEVDLDSIASITVGFSGADLRNLVNEAALHAIRHKQQTITSADFNQAHNKVLLGAERKDLLNPSERQRTAIHESGHALMAYYLPHSDPIRLVSIIPRGRALGMTEQLPTEDRHNYNEDYLSNRLAILLGGRCAEQQLLNSISSGAADDLEQATKLAKMMIAQWGMSKRLGPVHYHIGEEHPFLGYELTQEKDFSDATAQLIDEEVKKLLQDTETITQQLLQQHETQLKALAEALQKEETLELVQIEQIIQLSNSDKKAAG